MPIKELERLQAVDRFLKLSDSPQVSQEIQMLDKAVKDLDNDMKFDMKSHLNYAGFYYTSTARITLSLYVY